MFEIFGTKQLRERESERERKRKREKERRQEREPDFCQNVDYFVDNGASFSRGVGRQADV